MNLRLALFLFYFLITRLHFVTGKRPCRHGASCYRKNPSHFKEYSHPGDLDYQSKDEDTDEDDSRPECEHGTACYRKNPEHIKNYKHTRVPQPKRRAKVNKEFFQKIRKYFDGKVFVCLFHIRGKCQNCILGWNSLD